MLPVTLPWLLSACFAVSPTTWDAVKDADGDGYDSVAFDGEDCDDTNAGVYPDAVEVCNEVDDNCDGVVDEGVIPTWHADGDADGAGADASTLESCEQPSGFIAQGGECDDANASVRPSAIETCDGVDQDCDGSTDEDALDALSWYADADLDGYGDAVSTTTACDVPTGFVSDATDCDDTRGDVHPGAAETCDDADQDCDGSTDEDALDALTWYADADLDGYGDATSSIPACDAPTGTVADATDCDDGDAGVNPGVTETCNDVDDDCDGSTDEDALDALTWHADADLDGYGDAVSTATACEAPTGFVSDATDCDDDDPDVYPDVTETCNDVDDDCDGSTDEDPTDASSWYADADADGYGDAASTTTACDAPTGYVEDATDCDDDDPGVHPGGIDFPGSGDGNCDGVADETPALAEKAGWTGAQLFGVSLAVVGDMDGDGASDLAVGSWEDTVAVDAGAVYLFSFAGAAGTTADAYARLKGIAGWDLAGMSVAPAGDANADGVADLLVGAYHAGGTGERDTGPGAAYLVSGPVTGDQSLSIASLVLTGVGATADAGVDVSALEDVTGDGRLG